MKVVLGCAQSFKFQLKTTDTGTKPAKGISAQALVKFFLPTLAIWLIGPSLSLIDTAVVGSKSSTQLAALGPGCILCDCNGYFFTFLAVASNPSLLTPPQICVCQYILYVPIDDWDTMARSTY